MTEAPPEIRPDDEEVDGIAVNGNRSQLAGLAKKLSVVMSAVERVKKRGHNSHFNYDFATEADINAAVRKHLSAQSVILVPAIRRQRREGSMTFLDMQFTFVDGESGSTISVPWAGAAEDKGDKGVWKAITGAVKYFVAKTFLIPTGDDPERDDRKAAPATAKPDKETRKARAVLPLDSGAVYIEKVVPRTKGNVRWQEVVVSTGESYPVQEHQHQLIDLCIQLAQGTQAVVLETHNNDKGRAVLDGVRRWPEQQPEAPQQQPQGGELSDLNADLIPFVVLLPLVAMLGAVLS